MEIKSTLTNRSGQILDVMYKDIKSELDLGDKKVNGVHAYCFCGDKLVLVFSDKKGYWTPPGGGVEEGESICDAVSREVKEETNMKVLKQRFVGFQEISEPEKLVVQTRSVCIVEPYGPFVEDPDDGEITKIELIDPKDYKKYFDWGKIGDHIMERVLRIKDQMTCSFCTNQEVKERTIVENDLAFAFPTNTPIVPGHTLVCPIRCVAKFEDLTKEEKDSIFHLAGSVKKALEKTFDAEGFNYAWNENEIGGQSVPHFHLHILPRKKDDTGIYEYEPRKFLYRSAGNRSLTPQEELAEMSRLIKKNF